ncbi:SDR family oxidoreductase [Halopseudomonas salina]|uniref:Short-chain dehydrogenase n=1 Tax=Halopseudomonas salina TaxID=1323744 RepID=A0ABQ1NU41_9GAMM|nr:SDR family oxidoreductase [Halopseudomonas salina]GGC84776.1 short-chain dehydrogenase [Halopseudomonas salina]
MTDPVLLITGASSGIGAATAREAAKAGYRLVLAARSADKLHGLQQELGGAERVITVACDVQSQDDQLRLAAEAERAFGQIDAIFANAGRGGEPGGFSKADPAVWRDMILTNVLGVGMTVQACLPALRKTRGHILMTGSAAGRVTIPGSMYSATKWAVSAIGYGLREELRGSGIRVTLIEPGMVDTPFFDKPPERALQPEDVARAVLYALSQPAHVDVNEVLIRPTPALE